MEKAGAYQGALRAEEAFFELCPDPIVVIGFDGIIRCTNPAVRTIGGFSEPELTGSGIRLFVFHEDLPKIDAVLARLARGERSLRAEIRSTDKVGRIRLLQWHAVRFDAESVLAVGRDISEQRYGASILRMPGRAVGEQDRHYWVRRHLRQRRRQFECLAKAAPVGIFQSSPEGRCTYVNKRYLEITGFSLDETLGSDCWEHVVEEDRAELARQRLRLTEQDGRLEWQYRLRRKDGQVIWVLGQASTELDESGRVAGCIGSVTDINQSKLNELELRNYREHLEDMVRERTLELEAVNRELESFSYSVSHDLRAPLRAISGFNAALLDEYGGKLDDQALFFLRRIQANSRQMGELIDDLLELSKVTKAELLREWVDLSALSHALLAELRLANPARDVEVRIAEGLKVFADPQLLRSMMHNLLGNAWKYSAKETKAIIEVGAVESPAGRSTFFVRDNGVGFDMACVQDLFRAFQRLHDSSQFEGTGIGLATVQRIVTRHGGKVWAEAEEGRGASFFFVLH